VAQTPDPAGPPDAPLTGAPPPRRLVREIMADPARVPRLDVVGPGGHGKTVLLDAIARVHREAGATVLREVPTGTDPAVVVIDDAHLLPDAALAHLTEIAAAPGGVVVVAHRPWPRRPALAALGARLAAHRPPLVLEPLEPGGVAARAARLLPDRPRRDLVEYVVTRTGGVPLLVDRLLAAVLPLAPAKDPMAVPLPERAPAGLLTQLGYDLAALDDGVRGLILARAIGAPADAEVLAALLARDEPRASGRPASPGYGFGGGTGGIGEAGADAWGGGFGAAAGTGGFETGVDGTGDPGRWGTGGFGDPPAGAPASGTLPPPPRVFDTASPAAPAFAAPAPSSAAAVDDLLDAARATGLLAADAAPIPLVSEAVLAAAPPHQVLELRRELAEIELRRGGDVVAAARGLLGTGATGPRMAELFVAAGDAAAAEGSAEADRFYAAAAAAGTPPTALAARRAEAAMLAGRIDDALTRADEALAAAGRLGADELVRAGRVAAAALARRGLPARSAQLYGWLAGAGAPDAVLAVPVLLGAGALDQAREALRPSTSGGLPTALSSGVEELTAQGALDSVVGEPAGALSQLARAAALLTSSRRAALMPDTPAGYAALVAVQSGEIDVARSVLDGVVTSGLGGAPATVRHRLLQAWIAVQRGAVPRAVLDETPAGTLEPREELLAAALEVALARRASDLASLHAVWGRAREALVRYPVDLWSLPVLGELLVGSARLREQGWMRPQLEQAWAILGRLGSPALWTAPLHWSCLQAAIAAGDAPAAGRHASELAEVAESSRYATALAAAAAEWMRLLGGEVDATAVDAAARGLHAVGLTWEGGRLAGQAAIRTEDRRDMAALLGCARALQGPAGAPEPEAAERPARRPAPEAALDDSPGQLSEREREVAVLVLQGLTYKQIGEQLFISAKTVEHHVARMRQRLGSTSRGELFAQLRQVVGQRG
jgi:DNA-binding CsgD family transcriptional regulator